MKNPEKDYYEKEARVNIHNQEGKEQVKVMEFEPEEEISNHPSSDSNMQEKKKHSKDSKDKKRPPIRAWRTCGLPSLVTIQKKPYW